MTGRRSGPTRSYVSRALLAAAATLAVLAALTYAPTGSTPLSPAPAEAVDEVVVVAAGDVACRPGGIVSSTACQHPQTASLVSSLNPVAVFPLGDTQYDSGTTAEYQGAYEPTWGAFKSKSRPAVGNHEYMTTGASGYFGYFGSNAGDPAKGYYSYNVTNPTGTVRWHIVSLNTECAQIGGCGAGSPQETWLKADLAANRNVCTLAYAHRPRFSSGDTVGSSSSLSALWNALYNAGADLFLTGHAHHYERFLPQTSSGTVDTAKGLTEFILGTGGKNFQRLVATPVANSVVRNNNTFGVLKLTLRASSYEFTFLPIAGSTFTDTGTGTCHNAPVGDTTPPPAPTGLRTTSVSANSVGLAWDASTDAVGYYVWRAANGATPAKLTTNAVTTTGTTYTDASVVASTTYEYQVSAVDAAGNESAPAPVPGLSVTTPAAGDTTPPTAPRNLQAEVIAHNEVDLGWDASTDTGTGVSGYKVYRQGPGETTDTLLATTVGAETRYADLTVQPGSTYTYRVSAYDGAGLESVKSGSTSATTPAGPGSKTFVFRPAGDATINQTNPTATSPTASLTVDASPVTDAMIKFNVATTGCESLTSATLELTNNANGSNKGGDVYTTGPNWTESTVNWSNAPTRGTLLNSLGPVSSGGKYPIDVTPGVSLLTGTADFRIGSTSTDGAVYFSREAGTVTNRPKLTVVCSTSAPVTDTEKPTVPTSLSASPGSSGEINLAWNASTDNVGVTGYNIYRATAGAAAVEIGNVSGTSQTYQDTTVTAGTTYTYTVKAIDAAGNLSDPSNAATATASSAPPAAPTNLQASVSGSTVNLTWTASTSTTVTGYNIYRGPAGGTLVKINSSTTASYADTNVPSGSYDYAVTAVATGGTESARSNVASVTVGTTAQTFTFRPTGDATIASGSPSTNYGAATTIDVDNSPVKDFLVKFQVATTGCTRLTSATLRLANVNSSPSGGAFYTIAGSFTESTVTYSNAPARGTLLGSLGSVTAGQSYSVDVTQGVGTLNGEVGFRAGSSNSDGADYSSKEAAVVDDNKPTLIVTCS